MAPRRPPSANRRISRRQTPLLRKGQPILLLRDRNHPYRLVYDTIKIIDPNNAIGVMHIGRFPNGSEFATFVLAPHNYPFELATEEDRALIAAGPASRP